MERPTATVSSVDEFGFPCTISRRAQQRLKIRHFTADNQWNTRFPTLQSALNAPAHVLSELALTHGLSAAYRPDVWLQCARKCRVRCHLPDIIDYAAVSALGATLELEISKQIELDLPRTFPEQRDFAAALSMKGGSFDGSRSSAAACAVAANDPTLSIPGAGDIHDSVRRMLRAFCAAHPATGYLQSMNFIAAFILLVFGRAREQDAYLVFETFILGNLKGYYEPDMAALHADSALITSILRERQSRLIGHMDRLGLADVGALFLPRWLLCAFLNCFPSDITVRVWDCLFLDGPDAARVLCEISLAVFRMSHADLLACSGFADAVEVLKGVGLRVADSAELLHLSRHAECSLRSRSISSWREDVAGWTATWPAPLPEGAREGESAAGDAASVELGASVLGASMLGVSTRATPGRPNVGTVSATPAGGASVTATPASQGFSVASLTATGRGTTMRGVGMSSASAGSGDGLSLSMLGGGTPSSLSSMHSRLGRAGGLDESVAVPGPSTAARAVSLMLVVDGIGARSSPVAVDGELDRIFPSLPASPLPGASAAMRSLRSPLRSPLPLPALSPLRSPTMGRGGPGVATGIGRMRSPGLRSPALGMGASGMKSPLRHVASMVGFAPPAAPQPRPTPLDASALASALNSSVAASSTRKRQREAVAASSSLGAAAARFATRGFSAAAGAASAAASAMVSSGSTLQAAAVTAAARLATALASATPYPTAYSEYSYDDCGVGGGYGTMEDKGLDLIPKAQDSPRGGNDGDENAVCECAPVDGRASKRARHTPFEALAGSTGNTPAPSARKRLGAASVQMMMLSPPRPGTLPPRLLALGIAGADLI